MQGEKSYHMLNDREEDDLPAQEPIDQAMLPLEEQLANARIANVDWMDRYIAAADAKDELQRELDACRAALEPFARMHRWSTLAHSGDDAQVLWHKHWLTGKRMKLIVDHFRLAGVAYYHKGIIPTERKDRATEDAELAAWMAEEIERAEREA